jgi:intein-encoded DNA endonuclease-like protein
MTWEYIAGFFDGEGSLTHNGKGFRITIPQTNEEVLISIKDFADMGNIFKEKKRKVHWKDSWIYNISKQKDIYDFLNQIQKFVIVKKSKALAVLPELQYNIEQQRLRQDKHLQRRAQAIALRKQGLSYWRIGLEMGGLDRGYIRRIILHRY